MAKRRVLIELKHNRDLAEIAFAAGDVAMDPAVAPKIQGVSLATDYKPTPLPGHKARKHSEDVYDTSALFELATKPEESTYLVRGDAEESAFESLRANNSVAGVYSDPEIQPCIVCPGSPPVGSDADVERLLCVPAMKSIGMEGMGVMVAIVDTGINMAYLNGRGKTPTFDAARSWVPRAGLTPGALPVGHGTMCAFDACIAAPKCTLLDIAVLQSTTPGPTVMSGLLSDAVRAYRHLIDIMIAPRRPGESRSMVVNNSWGMFHPTWDFPVQDPGNYSDNPNHPFNRIVAELERSGADILFAAGNCGKNCPDGRCQNVTVNAIYGANGHPAVLCVAGVDTTKTRVGYSTIGPGRLARQKPDISGYTHFRGSGVYTADGGTSAATPVVAGVVAAVRSKRPYDPATPSTHPSAIRTLVTSTAEDLGVAGYDYEHGYGVVGGCALQKKFVIVRPHVIDVCRRYPWLCPPPRLPIEICKRYPWICRGVPRPPIPPIPPRPVPPLGFQGEAGEEELASADSALVESASEQELVEMAYLAGFFEGQRNAAAEAGGSKKDCDCKE